MQEWMFGLFLVATVTAKLDPRIKHYPPLGSNELVREVTNIIYDPTNQQILFGASNALYSTTLDLSQKKQRASLVVPDGPYTIGKAGKLSSMAMDENNKVLACTSHTTKSQCYRFQMDADLTLDSSWSQYGNKLAPSYTTKNHVLFVGDDFIFSTGMYGGDAYGISRLPYPHVDYGDTERTKTSSSQMSKESNVVSAVEIDETDYLYFFFNEQTQTESRKFWKSGIARICKYDKGGPSWSVTMGQFLTFLKIDLVCEMDGFYYDKIVSSYVTTHKINGVKEKFVYAIFNAVREDYTVSTICRYKATDILHLFQTAKLIDPATGKHEVMDADRAQVSRGKCGNTWTAATDNEVLYSTSSKTELYGKIKQTALFRKTGVSLSNLVVGDIENKNVQFLFATSTSGKVCKIVINEGKAYVTDEIEPFQGDDPLLSILKRDENIYVGGTRGVALFPLERCTSNLLCSTCVGKRDPHCGWDGQACVPVGDGSNGDLLQDLVNGDTSKCPPRHIDLECKVSVLEATYNGLASLSCEVLATTSGVQPTIVQWLKDDSKIFPGGEYTVMSTQDKAVQHLSMRNYTRHNGGIYKCIVEYDGVNDFCQATLKAEPIVPTDITTTTHTQSGETSIPVTGAPGKGGPKQDKAYFTEFILVLVILFVVFFACILATCIALGYRRRHNVSEVTEVDGGGSNENTKFFFLPFKHRLNRKNSEVQKELLKKKNTADRVYKPTTCDVTNGADATLVEPV